MCWFLFSMRCVYARMCIFVHNRIWHAGEGGDLSNPAHTYLFYSQTGVELTRGHSETLLLPVPFEQCMCPDQGFFLVEHLGREERKHTGLPSPSHRGL